MSVGLPAALIGLGDVGQWQKQLRHYFDDRRNCVLRMVDGKFSYTYEYQGNAPKLVHTPLTDKCCQAPSYPCLSEK